MKARRQEEEKEKERSFLGEGNYAGLRAWSAVDVIIGERNFNGGEYL